MRTVSLSILDSVGVASPCHESWENMNGDERTRHCASCKLNVHNLSGMTRREAESFLREVAERKRVDPTARACIRFYRRHDGTILTQDCPVGLVALRRRARMAVARAAAAIGAACATAWAAAGIHEHRPFASPRVRELEPFRTLSQWLAPASNAPPPPMMGKMIMGDMACPVTPMPTPSPAPAPDGATAEDMR